MANPQIINDKTLVPIGFIFLIIVGVFSIANTLSRVNTHDEEIKNLRDEIKVLQAIDQRLSRIEGALGVK